LFLSVGANQEHDPKVKSKVGTVGYRREHANFRLIWKAAHLVEASGEGLLVVPVNFAIVLLRPAGLLLRRTGVDSCRLAQVRIRTEPGNEISSQAGYCVKDLLLRVEAVSDPVRSPTQYDTPRPASWSYRSIICSR